MDNSSVSVLLDYYASVRERTSRLVPLIPAERLEWAPAAGGFTFGDLLRHLGAMERFIFAENAHGRPSRYPGHGRELADGHPDVARFFDDMYSETRRLIGELSDSQLERHCPTPAGGTIRTWKWLRAMLEHHNHHRGQIYVMLGLLGIPTPPMFGLTSEEVRQRSGPITLGTDA